MKLFGLLLLVLLLAEINIDRILGQLYPTQTIQKASK